MWYRSNDTNLRSAIQESLNKIGATNIPKIVPEFKGLKDYSIIPILMDESNILFKEMPLLSFYRFVRERQNTGYTKVDARSDLELHLAKAELMFVPRTSAVGVILEFDSTETAEPVVIDGPNAPECDMIKTKEFIPLVGLSIGPKKGKTTEWLESVSKSHPDNRIERQTEALRRLLVLWKIIIRTWMTPRLILEPSEVVADTLNETTNSGPKQQQKGLVQGQVCRSTVFYWRGSPYDSVLDQKQTSAKPHLRRFTTNKEAKHCGESKAAER